jgi:ABC-2 type transport system permease protein
MNAVIAIAMKDLVLLVRDRANAFFTFVFPILLAVFFGLIFRGSGEGSGGKLTIALVDEDISKSSAMLVTDIRADTALDVMVESGEPAAPLSREMGLALVRRGKADATIIIPKGFGAGAAGLMAGGQMKLEGVVPPGRAAEAGLLTGKLNELAFRQMTRGFGDPEEMKQNLNAARKALAAATNVSPLQKGAFEAMLSSVQNLSETSRKQRDEAAARGEVATADPMESWRPVEVSITEVKADREGPTNSFEISFPQGVVWGLMGCVTAFGLSLANERSRGTLMRLTTAPISRHQIILGKALSCFIACVLVQALLLATAMVFFSVKVASWPMMIVAVLMSSLGFVGVMMAMAGLSRTEGGGSGMGRAVILILAMIGGGTVPLFFLPPFMQTLSSVSPFKWATLAFEGALWRGFGPAEMVLPCAVLLGFCVGGFAIGVWGMRWTTRA